MADPIKIPGYAEEEVKEERRLSPVDRRSSRREKAAGYFREHPRAKWVLALLAVVVIAGVVFIWHYYSVRESTDDAQVDSHINPLSARVSGTVLRVLADENQIVPAGTLLVELDPKDYEVAVARARADLADAEAAAVAAQVGVPLTTTTSSSQLTAADSGLPW